MTLEEQNKKLLELIKKHEDFEHALMFTYLGFLRDKAIPKLFVQNMQDITRRASKEYKSLKDELRSIKSD